jgi:5-methylthioadenosine/S-adenosylhomocysteine deaminase
LADACDLLLTGARLLPIRPAKTVLFPGSVAIRAGEIVAMGNSREIDPAFAPARIVDCGGKAVLPGFVDAHVHAGMSLLKAYPCDKALPERLSAVVWPFMAAIDPAATVKAARHACLEFVRAGITSFADMFPHIHATADAVEEAGLRAVLAPYLRDSFRQVADDIDLMAKQGRKNISMAVGVQSLYGATQETLREAGAFARSRGLPVHIHVAESRREIADGNDIGRLAQLDLMPKGSILAHAVHVTEDEIRLVHEAGAGVAHNPSANAKLGTGMAAAADYLANEVPVGLGTDSVAANDRHDMFEEMRLAVLLSRMRGQAHVLCAWDALEMATLGGARVLGLDHLVGSIETGKKADLILVDMEKAHFEPLVEASFAEGTGADRLAAHLVFAAGAADVDSVLLSGEFAMQGRQMKLCDPDRIVAEARQAASVVLQRAGLAS